MKYLWLFPCLALFGCQTTYKKIKIPPTSLPAWKIATSKNNPCSQINNQTPSIKKISHKNQKGVWLPIVKFKCLTVRQRIALTCKKKCEDYTKKVIKAGENKEEKLIAIIKNQQREGERVKRQKQTIKIIAIVVSTIALAELAYIILFNTIGR